jgi:hypothetical protein
MCPCVRKHERFMSLYGATSFKGCREALFLLDRERVEAAKLIQRARARPPVGVLSGFLHHSPIAYVQEKVSEGMSFGGVCRAQMLRRWLFRAPPWSR